MDIAVRETETAEGLAELAVFPAMQVVPLCSTVKESRRYFRFHRDNVSVGWDWNRRIGLRRSGVAARATERFILNGSNRICPTQRGH